MITWMQRHKKWLIVTIWISTIAFVGAGFVGWGSYNYGKSDGAVAIVGEKEVPLKDLQSEYSALYSQYNQMFGNNFNQEMAKQFKLEEAAFQRIVQKYLLINYADELGLAVTDDEVAKEILKIEAFQKDGKFDKNTYLSLLKQNRKTATEFEEQFKNDLLVAKVQQIFNTPVKDVEAQNIAKLYFLEDKVEVKVIDIENMKVSVTSQELQEFHEKNKENYKSPEGFDISYSIIENIEGKEKKAMKKIALKQYLKLKKGEDKFEKDETIYATTHFLSPEDFKELTSAKPGDVLKPFYANDKYYVFKFNAKKDPQTLAFNDVSNQVKSDLTTQKRSEILDQKITAAKENFSGKDLGFISRESKPSISGLNESETTQLIQTIFQSTAQLSELKLSNKAVVFKIIDSRIKDVSNEQVDMVKSSIESIKNGEITESLIAKLQNKYEIKSFMGND